MFLCGIKVLGLEIALRQQVLRLCALRRTYLGSNRFEVRLRFRPLVQRHICFRTSVERFFLRLLAHRRVVQYLFGDVNSSLMASESLAASQNTEPCDGCVLTRRSKRMHPVERIERAAVVLFVVADRRHAHGRFLLVGVGGHIREDFVMLQRLGSLSQTVVRVREVVPRSGTVPSARTETGDIVAERDGRFLIRRLHVLHLRCRINQAVLLRRDGHIHLREVLGVGQIVVHVSLLHVECLQRL